MNVFSSDEPILSDAVDRLLSLGYTAVIEDKWALEFAVLKATNTVKNECNISAIPNGLHQVMVDMVCGEFLLVKKQSGQLEGFDFETAVKQVQAGDTNVTFAFGAGSSTPEQRFDALLAYLMNTEGLICYRKIKW